MTTLMTDEHYFTAHSSARLTFIIGVVMGMTIMTLGGLVFFIYVFSGGEIKSYAIAPLDTDSQILTEPIKDIVDGDQITIAGVEATTPITLVQYVDYECRFCKKFFPDVVSLSQEHSDVVTLVVKHYPLVQIHPNAKTASLAAYCAGEQGKLLEYSTALYERQNDLGDSTVYDTLARDLGLQTDAFATCRTAATTVDAIETQALEAQQLGIQTQPNLVIIRDGEMQLIDGYVNQAYLTGVLGL